ncbi:MAG: PilZ domain-containing protein [Candidatus Omnitrophica bacterium]|nr:PilZ domain-containing protein [Candidatus Omnitrophota bacterium]
MKIRIREVADISVIDVEGAIDIDASEFVETIGWLLKNHKIKILCNFESVEMVDYSGLSILAIAYKNVINHGGMMRFCNVGLHVKELFRLVQMEKVFQSYNSEEEAVESFNEHLLEMEQLQLRRKFKRLETNMEVRFRLQKPESGNGHIYSGKILNISGAGLFIYARYIFPVRTRLYLELFIPKELGPLEMEGMVIWVSDKNLQPHCHPGMGVEFVHVDTQQQKNLLEFIEKNVTNRSEA